MESPSVVETVGLSKTYWRTFQRDGIRALVDLDLQIGRGEVFGLLGPNGAGKTTLIKILLGVVQSTSGHARLFGKQVPTPASRSRVGFLPENHRFPDFLTANQMLDLFGRLGGVSAADRKRRIPELLERVNMSKWSDTRIRRFSKGMMQRVGIAQALVNDPDIVFLDEPTDGVDPVGRKEIRDILVWLKERGTTVFLNSHLLSEVEKVCTRVAILDKGLLAGEGTVQDLTAVQHSYRLTVGHVDANRLAGLPVRPDETGETVENVMVLEADVNSRTNLNALIDELRSRGIEIESVEPVRESLESLFIKLIEDGQSLPTRPAAQTGTA